MANTLTAKQSLSEIEHALAKSFPFPSTSVTHVTSSADVATVQISWVASSGSTTILDARCAMSLVFDPDALSHYAQMHGSERLRVREALRTRAEDALRERMLPDAAPLDECNLLVGVSAAMIDAAARGQQWSA